MSNKIIHTPEGVRDIYGKELLKKKNIKSKLHQTLKLFGFREIETPSFEFSDVYLNEVGTTPEKEMYRFFDKEGNMLVLRPDFTPSIARCASKYFVDDSMPIRLMYEGNVFNNTSDLQGKLKESTQMGAELIETQENVISDGEMICLVIQSLLNVGFTDFQVSLGNAQYFKGICDAAGLSDELIDKLREYISSKNYFGAEELLINNQADPKVISAILEVARYTTDEDIETAKKLVKNERSIGALEQLKEVYAYVKEAGLDKYVSIDLCMISKFNYYTGMIFRAYTYGTGDAIVKGGRYDNLLGKFGKPSKAIGFVFMVDHIVSALTTQKLIEEPEVDITWVVYDENHKDEGISVINKYRSEGKRTAAIYYDTAKTKEDYINYANRNDIKNIEFYI